MYHYPTVIVGRSAKDPVPTEPVQESLSEASSTASAAYSVLTSRISQEDSEDKMYASDDSVEVVQVPSMIDAAELYVKESGLAQRLTPPNGRQKILSRHSVESCSTAALMQPWWITSRRKHFNIFICAFFRPGISFHLIAPELGRSTTVCLFLSRRQFDQTGPFHSG